MTYMEVGFPDKWPTVQLLLTVTAAGIVDGILLRSINKTARFAGVIPRIALFDPVVRSKKNEGRNRGKLITLDSETPRFRWVWISFVFVGYY
jgi:hypothetical protein